MEKMAKAETFMPTISETLSWKRQAIELLHKIVYYSKDRKKVPALI